MITVIVLTNVFATIINMIMVEGSTLKARWIHATYLSPNAENPFAKLGLTVRPTRCATHVRYPQCGASHPGSAEPFASEQPSKSPRYSKNATMGPSLAAPVFFVSTHGCLYQL